MEQDKLLTNPIQIWWCEHFHGPHFGPFSNDKHSYLKCSLSHHIPDRTAFGKRKFKQWSPVAVEKPSPTAIDKVLQDYEKSFE